MKKLYILLLAAVAMLSSCESRLDIVPKGETTLDTVDDLESLINQQWRIYDWYLDYNYLTGQTVTGYTVPGDFGKSKNTLEYAYLFGDESVDRVNLASDDPRYSDSYKYIYYCNVLASKMPNAKGDSAKKDRLIAEAKVLRAWLHFIVVNFYAQPYDSDKAESLGGIAYVDNTNSGEQKTKLSLQATYDRILEDCSDEVLEKLSQKVVNNPCRVEVDFGYAVRAMALFQMKKYDEALVYANKALAANPFIEDRSTIASSGKWEMLFDSPNNLLFINSNSVTNMNTLQGKTLPKQVVDLFEEGDYLKDYSISEGIDCQWNYFDNDTSWGYGLPGCAIYAGGGARMNIFGINTEMMYYVAGECLIRQGKVAEGLGKIDMVRKKRIHPSSFVAFADQTSDQKKAMELLWNAKRIEFIISPVIFYDMKRRNTEPEYRVSVVHDLADEGTYTIRHDSPLWVYPFPMEATNYNESLTQNY